MDRSSTIDRINQKYLGARTTSFVAPNVVRPSGIVSGIAPGTVITRNQVTTVDTPIAPHVDVHEAEFEAAHHTPVVEAKVVPRNESGRICGCPWWLCLLLTILALLLLGVLIGFLTGFFKTNSRSTTGTTQVGTSEVNGGNGEVNGGTVE